MPDETTRNAASTTDECETCGNPDGVLCDECALEEHLGDIERAERLREEDAFLYTVDRSAATTGTTLYGRRTHPAADG